ncbi:peroxiredoxin [Roseibium sp.]|uniref:peroxiredoxin n=1 Tax=Roseibium sp. TaxID=1936156 RepID=UPI003D13DB20
MTIAVGEKLPEATFLAPSDDGPTRIAGADFFAGKKVVLFGLPGAFTPTCDGNHLPGFLSRHDEIIAKGVDRIAVVSVNDVFVMKAWEAASGAKGKIVFLADGNATFAKAIGLDADMSVAGFGTRMRRFSMIVEDGTVTSLNLEVERGKAEISGAETILSQL